MTMTGLENLPDALAAKHPNVLLLNMMKLMKQVAAVGREADGLLHHEPRWPTMSLQLTTHNSTRCQPLTCVLCCSGESAGLPDLPSCAP
jgi:hypothetical protein